MIEVGFVLVKVNDKVDYTIEVPEAYHKHCTRIMRTLKNFKAMKEQGRPITLVVPYEELDDAQIEEYRKYFCKQAKQDKTNYIYFPCPVKIKED